MRGDSTRCYRDGSPEVLSRRAKHLAGAEADFHYGHNPSERAGKNQPARAGTSVRAIVATALCRRVTENARNASTQRGGYSNMPKENVAILIAMIGLLIKPLDGICLEEYYAEIIRRPQINRN